MYVCKISLIQNKQKFARSQNLLTETHVLTIRGTTKKESHVLRTQLLVPHKYIQHAS